ncbi:hypothetical protein A5656_10615 [Mycobacterium gordonae]|jgi:hypothetical protein|uniref:DUF3618 domain-containing protein n=1 Tax=Mycobacterium paragordonae TaxID=1389713 RepID=UPI0007EF3B56|nr:MULTISPECIES: DUF3618 domain-containing protein [Mycobacterium]OBK62589.1 hypothetical protein A5656_10615 [Mycobacterium gordonae]
MAEPDRTPSAAQPAEPGPDADMDDIERDIERTRSQLSGTVEALAAKANVPERAKETARAAQPTLILGASAVGVALVAQLWWRRRRS